MSSRTAAVATTHAAAAAAPVAQPVPPQAAPTQQAPLEFTGAGFAGLRSGAVVDADAERRAMTQRLLEQLAPALGLDPARLTIEVHAAGRARLDAAGARGLQEGATIWLHPAQYAPARDSGRYLLAHEATHAAQRRLT
ncbi:MAG: DUF4157 domain-containing protein, partial [Burkholderiales bacterium]|nr:DUF4157 domain-containing protein [Burkholderiales bacterium]